MIFWTQFIITGDEYIDNKTLTVMPFIGKVNEFTEGSESVENYVERLEQFFTANDIEDEKKVSVFLSVVGSSAYGVIRNLVQPALPKDKTYAQLVELMKSHYNPKPLIISERFKFNKRNQKEGEKVNDYVVELKRLSVHCDFGTFLDDALRDRFVCGLKSETTQRKLLAEDDLTFEGAVKIALAMEMAEKDTVSFSSTSELVNKVKSKSGKGYPGKKKPSFAESTATKSTVKGKECYRCGAKHHPESCTHKSTKCFNCSKIGHLAKKCRKPKASSSNYVGTNDSDSELELFVHTTYVKASSRGINVSLNLNNHETLMEVDTGSSCTLINELTYKQLYECELKPTKVNLRGYSGNKIETIGECEVSVQLHNANKMLRAIVVKGDKPNLLGRDWLTHVKLDWKSIFEVKTVKNFKNLRELKLEYKDVFTADGKPIKGFKAKINLKENAQTWFHKARPVPYSLKEKVTKELKRLESEHIIEPVEHSEWASPLVVVPKADKDSIRLCGDYKVSVNREISEEQYPLPNVDDMFATLAGGQKFSKLDLSQAYTQVELDDAAKSLLTVNTHLGLFRTHRLPYGVSSAPAIFQSLMDSVLSGLPGVVCRIDDILITAENDDKHLLRLEEVLRRLRNYNIKLNPEKCEFMVDQVVYMGHLLDKEGIHPTDEKTRSVLEAPTPKNVSELKSYLGLLNYYGAFLPNLSSVVHPLYQLLRKDTKWVWSKACEQAFQASKKLLTSNKLLTFYDPGKPLLLACDASSYGLGAVISHVMEDGTERPVAYASRTLSASECNYAQVEKEALAIVFGVKKFHKYLFGRKFTLLTDHTALTSIFGPRKGTPALAAARLQRWAIILSGYTYEIRYRKSAQHGNCDGLSRLPVVTSESEIEEKTEQYVSFINEIPISSKQVAEDTRKSPVLSSVLHFVYRGWPNHCDDEKLRPYFNRRHELSVDSGVLLWGLRVIIPEKLRETMLVELHDQHWGVNRMKSLARGYVWWPNLDSDIENVARNCEICQSMKRLPAEAPLHPWARAGRPMERIHMDFAEYQNQSFLVIIDSFSKWMEVISMNNTSSQSTIDKLRLVFASTGLPEEIVSDNGPQFKSREFSEFCRLNGIRHTFTPPYHPSSNGQAERAVQVFKRALKSNSRNRNLSVNHRVADFLLKYRITPHTTTGVEPCILFCGRQLRSRLLLARPDKDKVAKQKQCDMKKYHDKAPCKSREFEKGDRVAVKTHTSVGKWQWIPGIIHKVLGKLTYLVKCGSKIRYCHIDHLVRRDSEWETSPEPVFVDLPSTHKPLRDQSTNPEIRMPLSPSATPVVATQPPPPSTPPRLTEVPTVPTESSKPITPKLANTANTEPLVERRYPLRERKPPKRFEL